MPIHHAIWRVGEQPAPLVSSRLVSEQQLEEMIVQDRCQRLTQISLELISLERTDMQVCWQGEREFS